MNLTALALITCFFTTALSSAQSSQPATEAGRTSTQSLQAYRNYGQPVVFEANQGQTDAQVKFISRGKGYTAFLTAGSMVLSLRPAPAPYGQQGSSSPATQEQQSPVTALQFRLLGAARATTVVGENQLPGKVNYFIGNNPEQWHANVPIFSRVRYRNVYPGIDLIYYGSHQQLEYDFALSPGADPSQIQLEIDGASRIDLDAEGNLVLFTQNGELHFQTPTIYQESNGIRVPIAGGYIMKDSTHLAFRVGEHNPNARLVIDPVLVYSTFLGGSGNDEPSGIAVDSTGSVYIVGFTDSVDFPSATIGSLPAGNTHVFIAKLDPTGSNLVYADYIGGNGEDYGFALALDQANELYVTGSTSSSDFPTVNAYDSTYPGSFNGFLTKVSVDGASLLYSTYFGGNGSDAPVALAIDSTGSALVAGSTSSINFPVANAYQSTASANGGGLFGTYGFITKFSPDGSYLPYSTYFAGNSNVPYNCGGTPCWAPPFSAISGLAVDANGNAYVAGGTNTYNFPTTPSAYLTSDATQQWNPNVSFASKFSSAGILDYSTYFYESSGFLTNITAIAIDSSGNSYVTGSAVSDGTFPITSTTICNPATYQLACGYAFVTKFDSTGSTLLFSTFLGPNNSATPRGIVLDSNSNAYVLATTSSSSFNIVNGLESYANGSDLLLVEIDPLATTELEATYLGGSEDDIAAGIAIDSTGNLFIVGSTDSTDFPITQGAFQSMDAGNIDSFVLKIGPGSAQAVSLSPETLQYSSQAIGSTSPAQAVLLRNMGSSSLAISSINVGGEFAESNNCGSSVQPASSCTFSVAFTPTSAGISSGSVVIQDNAAGSPHIISLSGTGSGPLAGLVPSGLTFATQSPGTSSSAQSVSLANNGNQALVLGTIQVTGDFAQTNNCPLSLAPTSSCTVNVTFTPTASGARNGTLSVSDNAQGSPQTVSLTGTGAGYGAPIVALSPGSLSFSNQSVGSPSSARIVTLTNVGNAPLSIGSIETLGDFAQVNSCPVTLAANLSCTITINFAPSVSGNRNGSLRIADNAQGSPQAMSLSGEGVDFALSASPTAASVQAGSTAIYKITVAALGGAYPSSVQMACSGAPAESSCAFSPSSVTPGSNAAIATFSVSTTAAVGQAGFDKFAPNRSFYAIWMSMQGIATLAMFLIGFKKRATNFQSLSILSLTVAGLMLMSGCAGGTGIVAVPQSGTKSGSYTVTVTASSGNLQHSLPLTLTLQ